MRFKLASKISGDLFLQLMRALAHIHSPGLRIVHRDIKVSMYLCVHPSVQPALLSFAPFLAPLISFFLSRGNFLNMLSLRTFCCDRKNIKVGDTAVATSFTSVILVCS